MHRTPRVVAPLTFIAGVAYGAVVRTRNILYDKGWLRRSRLRSPVISIGNITTGGTGKTPLVIYTARKIVEMGCTPVVLSRGYGRPDSGASRIIAPGEPIRFPARELGDEPALIRRRVPEAWFGISKDRFRTGSRIERNAERTICILDDGFQHRKLHRDTDIAVIDPTQLLIFNRLLPRGTLREPAAGLRRCTAIILNAAQDPEEDALSMVPLLESLAPQAGIFHCRQHIQKLVSFDTWEKSEPGGPRNTLPRSVFLVAALGNPERFHGDVEALGIRCSGCRFFRDHYGLGPSDWEVCIRAATQSGAEAILISEKDAVKISRPPDFPLLVAVQATEIRDERAFEELLRQTTY
jgi:tetraacyldisaccharide 4'-kinase